MTSSEDSLAAAGEKDATLLLYDYFKHLTTLSLLALGGVLSLSQAGVAIGQRRLILISALVGGAGALALAGLDTIVKARVDGRRLGASPRWVRAGAAMLIGLGIGAFAAAFLKGVA